MSRRVARETRNLQEITTKMEGSLMKSENFKHRLIDEVRKREILWDRNSTQVKDAKNQVLRTNAWNDVAGKLYEFNVTGAQCRSSFKSLRDQYIRLYQVYQRTKKKPTWANYDRLTFLEKCVGGHVVSSGNGRYMEENEELGTTKLTDDILYYLSNSNHTKYEKFDVDSNNAKPIIVHHDRYLRSSTSKPPSLEIKQQPRDDIPEIAHYESVAEAQDFKDHDYQEHHFAVEDATSTLSTRQSDVFENSQPSLSPSSNNKRRSNLIKLTPAQITLPPHTNLDYITNFGISIAGQIKNLHSSLHTETMFEVQRILFEQEKKSQQIVFSERHSVDQEGYVNMQM